MDIVETCEGKMKEKWNDFGQTFGGEEKRKQEKINERKDEKQEEEENHVEKRRVRKEVKVHHRAN